MRNAEMQLRSFTNRKGNAAQSALGMLCSVLLWVFQVPSALLSVFTLIPQTDGVHPQQH